MKVLMELCSATDDLAVIRADREADGWTEVWAAVGEGARAVTINDRAGNADGAVGARIVLVFTKD